MVRVFNQTPVPLAANRASPFSEALGISAEYVYEVDRDNASFGPSPKECRRRRGHLATLNSQCLSGKAEAASTNLYFR